MSSIPILIPKSQSNQNVRAFLDDTLKLVSGPLDEHGLKHVLIGVAPDRKLLHVVFSDSIPAGKERAEILRNVAETLLAMAERAHKKSPIIVNG